MRAVSTFIEVSWQDDPAKLKNLDFFRHLLIKNHKTNKKLL